MTKVEVLKQLKTIQDSIVKSVKDRDELVTENLEQISGVKIGSKVEYTRQLLQ